MPKVIARIISKLIDNDNEIRYLSLKHKKEEVQRSQNKR